MQLVDFTVQVILCLCILMCRQYYECFQPKSPLGGVHRPSSMENSAVPDSNISENQQSDGSADANGTNSPVARERPGSGKQTDVAVTTDSQNGASESVTRDKKSTNPDALRHSLSAGRKKILSMFKDKPSDSPPARPSKPPRRGVEISGPVTSKSDSARLPVCDSFIPIQSDTEKISQENPYCEVYDEDEFSDVSHEGSMKPDEPAKARSYQFWCGDTREHVVRFENYSKHNVHLFFFNWVGSSVYFKGDSTLPACNVIQRGS